MGFKTRFKEVKRRKGYNPFNPTANQVVIFKIKVFIIKSFQGNSTPFKWIAKITKLQNLTALNIKSVGPTLIYKTWLFFNKRTTHIKVFFSQVLIQFNSIKFIIHKWEIHFDLYIYKLKIHINYLQCQHKNIILLKTYLS